MELGTIGISEEHLELHRSVRRWVEARVDPAATKALLDRDDEPLPAFWDDLVAQGWLGLHVDAAHGGEGFGLPEQAVVLEELGRACAPGPFLPTVSASAVIAALGDDEQQARWLPGLAAGSALGAVGLGDVGRALVGPTGSARRPAGAAGDPDTGLLVERRGADLVVSGVARPVLGGVHASLFVVPALAEDGPLWLVLDRSEVEVRSLPSTDATRRVVEIRAEAATVGGDRQLGFATGEGGPTGSDAVVAERVAALVAAESVGGIAWCTATAAGYAAEREQFGRPIGQFQAVKHRCAGMAVALERSRAAVWDAVRGSGGSAEQAMAARAAGALVPADFFGAAKDCVQVLGGIGYTWDHDAHVYLKRALALHQLLGGPHPWREAVAALAVDGVRRSITVDLPPEAEPVRAEVRAFVAEVQARPKNEWTGAMADAGYLTPHWPVPWGRSAAPLEQLVIDQEFADARLRRPHLQVGAWVLPTIIAHGSIEQQERWVGPTLRGELFWCQLFSEPGAGSDLASLATRAVRDEARGGWVVTGQKVWTTMAHLAGWGLLLARTGPPAPVGGWGPADREADEGPAAKHRGITCFVVEMSSPGIEIRPLRELTGAEFFNEVFFTDVFVPDDCVIGEVDGGWEAARTTLANERVSMGSGSSFGPGVETVVQLLAALDPPPPVLVDEVGGLVAEAQAVAALGVRATLRALEGAGGSTAPGAESSVRKLLGVEHEQRVQEVGLDLLGPAAAVADGQASAWVNGFLGNRALSIAGGTSDVQRNIVAERLLGLPKDP